MGVSGRHILCGVDKQAVFTFRDFDYNDRIPTLEFSGKLKAEDRNSHLHFFMQ